jgi:hypothetical protein
MSIGRVIGVLPSKEACAALEHRRAGNCTLDAPAFARWVSIRLRKGERRRDFGCLPAAQNRAWRLGLALPYPSLKVDRNDVGPADDRHDPFTSIAGSILQYRCHSKRCRGLHDKSRMAIKQSHSLNDTIFLN